MGGDVWPSVSGCDPTSPPPSPSPIEGEGKKTSVQVLSCPFRKPCASSMSCPHRRASSPHGARPLDSRFRGNDARPQALAVYVCHGHLAVSGLAAHENGTNDIGLDGFEDVFGLKNGL